jgi:cell division protein FtsB
MNSQHITGYFKKVVGYGMLVLFIFMGVAVIRNIGKVASIRGEVSKEREKIERLKVENEELQKRIAQTQSDEFVERQIRDKLGLIREGEIVVVLPDEGLLRSFSPKINIDEDSLPDPNWKKWLKLFL